MLAFHGVILLALGWALRRQVGSGIALVTIALLLIDPTIAAHLPVVLTDLPLTLLGALAVLLAIPAFRTWRPVDLALASGALGLALVSKHSAIPVGLAVLGFGVLATLWEARRIPRAQLMFRLGAVASVMAGAYVVMWALYGFRFAESPNPLDTITFNRPIADKIADLNSSTNRAILQFALDHQLLPRAYLWGLADIIRAGVEGRQDVMYVFGRLVFGDTPWYFFPAVVLAKLPLGTLALAIAGSVLLVRRKVPAQAIFPAAVMLGWAAFYMVFVMRGNSGYAGIRHAAPVFPTIALLAAFPVLYVLQTRARGAGVAVGAALCASCVSALPTMRPWEYHNELAGGTDGAWMYFADDGLENGQRVKELAAYYDAHVRGTGERAYDFYDLFDNEKKVYGLEELIFPEENPEDTDTLAGTMFVNTRYLGPRPLYDYAAFRGAQPVARFGNLMVYKGEFRITWLRASRRLNAARTALEEEPKDPRRAEQLLEEAEALYPDDYRASFELGNLLLERGAIDPAISAYARSRERAPKGDGIVRVLSSQIEALRTASAGAVRPLRNPWLE
jgi:hypothetical protein